MFVTVLIMLTDSIGTFGNFQDNKVAYIVSREVRSMINVVEEVYVLDDKLCTQITFLKDRLEKVLKTVPEKDWLKYSNKHAEQFDMIQIKERKAA